MLQLRREWQYHCLINRDDPAKRQNPPTRQRRGSAVITMPHRTPFSPVLAQLDRMLLAKAESLSFPHLPDGPQPNDPVFLQDYATLTPDQMQEVHYGQGRSRLQERDQ